MIAKRLWAKLGASERQLDDAAGIIRMQHEALDHVYVRGWVETLELQGQWDAARERAG